jgi:type IV secretory pathway VirB2 component (pilin)
MHSFSAINLALSLLFGVGQIIVGGALVLNGRRQWRRAGVLLMMLAGTWFVCSGTIELFVSGMESVQRLSGVPDSATFSLWRGRADGLLALATVAILLIGIGAMLSGKISWRRNSHV